MRGEAQLLKHGVVSAHRLGRVDHAVDDQAQELDERELAFRPVDLAPVQRDLGPVLLGFPEHVEGVDTSCRPSRPGCRRPGAGRSVDQLFHRLRTVIDDLQKQGPPRRRHAGQRAGDVVVDEPRQARPADRRRACSDRRLPGNGETPSARPQRETSCNASSVEQIQRRGRC